jgi:hypothetical protein
MKRFTDFVLEAEAKKKVKGEQPEDKSPKGEEKVPPNFAKKKEADKDYYRSISVSLSGW